MIFPVTFMFFVKVWRAWGDPPFLNLWLLILLKYASRWLSLFFCGVLGATGYSICSIGLLHLNIFFENGFIPELNYIVACSFLGVFDVNYLYWDHDESESISNFGDRFKFLLLIFSRFDNGEWDIYSLFAMGDDSLLAIGVPAPDYLFEL